LLEIYRQQVYHKHKYKEHMRIKNFTQKFDEIRVLLDKANELNNQVWRIWQYSQNSKTLVLCGYNLPFNVTSFIIFRGVSRICLNQWIENGKIKTSDETINKLENKPLISEETKHLILFVTADKSLSQYIICKEMMFITLPKGTYV
jgi:hypothetical protein